MNSSFSQSPSFFNWLEKEKLINPNDAYSTSDGFCMLGRSLASILISREIVTFPDREGKILECRYFFDDWFLFAVPDHETYVYGLLKMREQEHDLEKGIRTDGDTPGVTISFIALNIDMLKQCLEDPSSENRRKMGLEINRVVAYPEAEPLSCAEGLLYPPAGRGSISDCRSLCKVYCKLQQ